MDVCEFEIVANGIHPLLLGMDRNQIDSALGEEPKVDLSRLPNEDAYRYQAAHARVVLRQGRSVEVALYPPAKVLFEGKDLFDNPSVWCDLVAADGDARETLGFVVLLRLGITLTGFHDGDSGQLAITAFERGRWDIFESQMRPFTL